MLPDYYRLIPGESSRQAKWMQNRGNMGVHRGVRYGLCLLLVCAAGCGGGGGDQAGNGLAASSLVQGAFSNADRGLGSVNCSTVPAIELVSPSGQPYACQRFVVQFRAAPSSTNSGTYRVGTEFVHSGVGDTEVEAGTWTLVGNELTCTATGSGVTAQGILDAPSPIQFPGYSSTIRIKFTTGTYKGQTVTYYNLNNPV